MPPQPGDPSTINRIVGWTEEKINQFVYGGRITPPGDPSWHRQKEKPKPRTPKDNHTKNIHPTYKDPGMGKLTPPKKKTKPEPGFFVPAKPRKNGKKSV